MFRLQFSQSKIFSLHWLTLKRYHRLGWIKQLDLPLSNMASLWTADTKQAINLGKGHPNPSLLPLAEVENAVQKAASAENSAVNLMQYGRMQGPPQLCELIADWMFRASGERPNLPTADNILITTGSGPGMSIACQLYSKPGDLIFVDSPGYFLSYFSFNDCRLKVVNVPTDDHGIDVDEIENLLKEGKKPSLIYTVPLSNNPTGVSMSDDRKKRLVQLAQQHNIKILSDEVYQFLSFDAELPKSLFEFDDASNPCVFAINSFSKLLGPGLRLGWIATHKPHMDRLLECGPLHSGGGFNPFMGAVVAEMIENGFVEKQVERVRKHYKSTCTALCDAIDKYVCTAVREDEEVTYLKPTGGFFCFLTLPERYDTQQLLEVAQKCGVSYFVGRHSSPDKSLFKNCVRLCFAFAESDVIVEGVKRLGKAMKEY